MTTLLLKVVVMDQDPDNSGLVINIANDQVSETNKEENLSNLKKHLKANRVQKLNKCNQCDFASYCAIALRVHLKTHTGEK